MKKLTLIAAVCSLCAIRAYSGGWVSFNNSATTLVITNNGLFSGSATVNAGYEVQLFYQPGSNPTPAPIFDLNTDAINLGSWENMNNAPVVQINPLPGRFNGGNETTGTDVALGGNAWFTVVGWSGGYGSLSDAYFSETALIGESTIFELTTGGGGSPPSTPVNLTAATEGAGFVGGSPFSGVILGVPEPSVIALSGLGAAGLLLFRRKK